MNAIVRFPVPASPAPAPAETGTSVLAARAVLARPTIQQWTARKFDKRASDQVARENGAANDAGRFNKLLVSREALAEIARIADRARTYHYTETLPWTDDGLRVLPSAKYSDYCAKMTDFRRDFASAVDSFVASYPDYCEAARARLGDLFNAGDYPPASAIRSRFSFDLGIYPVPSGADFRVEVGDAIRADVERRAGEALRLAMRDVAARITETVGTMATKLRDFVPGKSNGGDGATQGGFRDSLVENVRELADLLPSFNLASDPALDAVIQRMRSELLRHEPATLRQNSDVRRNVADAAQEIVDQMAEFFA